jgi:hypothetical protein
LRITLTTLTNVVLAKARTHNPRVQILCRRGGRKCYLVGINLTTSALETLLEARTVNNLLPAALHDDAVRCLLAIELS